MFQYLYKVMFYPIGEDGPSIDFTSTNPDVVWKYIVETLDIQAPVHRAILRGGLETEHEAVFTNGDDPKAVGTKCRIVCKN